MKEAIIIGDKIKKLREKTKLSRKEFAAKVQISSSHLSNIERGKGLPSLTVLERIAIALGVTGKSLIDF